MRLISFLCLTGMIITSAASALAQHRSDDELSSQRVQDRLERLEKDLNIIQQEVYRGGGSPSASSGKSGDGWLGRALGKEKSGGEANPGHVMEMEEEIRRIQGRIEETEHLLGALEQKLNKVLTDLEYRMGKLEQQPLPVQSGAAAAVAEDGSALPSPVPAEAGNESEEEIEGIATSSPPVEGNTPQNQYDAAFALLRQAKYPQAEAALKAFIDQNKGNSLVGNAYYWLGETYYVQDKYDQAAVNFLRGYQDFPEGNKVADNLLKLGMSLGKLKKKKEACTTFEKLLKEFPNADKDVKKKLAGEQKLLGC